MESSVRTSVDIPKSLHLRLRKAAARRGCSARQLVLESIERVVEEAAPPKRRKRLSLDPSIIPCTGEPIDLTNEQIYDLIEFP